MCYVESLARPVRIVIQYVKLIAMFGLAGVFTDVNELKNLVFIKFDKEI